RTPEDGARGRRQRTAPEDGTDDGARGRRTPEDGARGRRQRTAPTTAPEDGGRQRTAPEDGARGRRTPEDGARGRRQHPNPCLKNYGKIESRSGLNNPQPVYLWVAVNLHSVSEAS